MLDDDLKLQLEQRKRDHLYRQRRTVDSVQGVDIVVDGQSYINFCSNDYLGLANDAVVNNAFQQGIKKYGTGSGAAHLVTGHSIAHHALEEELADFVQRPRALLFSTGYMANLGVVSALADRHDTIIGDRLNHASLIDAAHLSRARMERYAHVDMDSLESLLIKESKTNKFVMSDGVFSMDGDIAPISRMASLCKTHNASLMIDDAHGLGVLGQHGRGSLEQLDLDMNDVPILMGTLGKAFGTFGAFVAGSEALIETLIQNARSYMYTTALPPAIAEATRASLRCVLNDDWRREQLQARITQFKNGASDLGLALMPSDTAIQPLFMGSAEKAMQVSDTLRDNGLLVSAIRPPTVPKATARLRITLSTIHQPEHVERLLAALESCQLDKLS